MIDWDSATVAPTFCKYAQEHSGRFEDLISSIYKMCGMVSKLTFYLFYTADM